MAFTRVNPGSWAVGDQLTSAQMNQLDVDHSKSLLGGNAVGAQTDFWYSQVTVATGGQFIAAVANAILATFAGAITTTAIGGITSSIGGGIQPGVAGGITSNTAGGIASNTAGGFQTLVAGGFKLGGGAGDWPTFTATRGKTYSFGPKPVDPSAIGGGSPKWDFSSFAGILVGHATTTFIQLWLDLPHNGATLSAVTLLFAVGQAHSGVPATMPFLSVQRVPVAFQFGSAPAGSQALSTTANQFVPTPGSGAAWFSSNQVQAFSYTCNQNNVIDNANYTYVISVGDENGANALTGNQFLGFQAIYTGINNMVFPF